MEQYLNYVYQILAYSIIILGLWLVAWVYFANRRDKINQIFTLFTISFLLWAPLPYFFNLPSLANCSLFLVRFGYGTVSLFLVSLYFFTVYFPREEKRFPILEKVIFITGIMFFSFSVFTDLIVKNIETTKWGINPLFGPAKTIYFGWVFTITLISTITIFKKYFILSNEEKIKVQYILLGLIIFIVPNIIFNVIFPFLGKTAQVKYYPFGNYSAIFLLGFTAYAIVKRELFGIKVVLTAFLVGLIAILLLFDALFFTQQFYLQIIKGVTLAIFLYFGYLLIKSVIQEIQRREEIEKINKSKTEFISMASHQLRTPLTAIKGYISMIMEGTYGEIPQIIKEKLNNVFISNERLINIVNELLDISKIDLGKMELKKEWVNIGDIVKSCYDELKILARQKNLEFKLEEPKEPLKKIYVDPLRIRQAFLNLIDNAIKYTSQGKVEIKISQKEKSILVTISDTGEGLSEKEKEQLFESFTRGSAGLTYFVEGTGLGLSITKKIIELHKGKVWAESEGKGKGSTFFVELPIGEIKNNLTHF